MAVQFDEGSWVWAPDEEELFLPAKVSATFKRGDPGETKLEDGEVINITAEQSQSLQVCDEQSLSSIDNMVLLSDLNNAALLHNLRIRFHQHNIYTSVGAILVAVNPFQLLPIYTPDWLEKYKNGGSRGQPPHIYGVADDAYRGMVNDRVNKSVIISGESGAGKTETMKLVLQYVAEVSNKSVPSDGDAGGAATASLEERILKANPVMEAFGNAKTTRNNNSSRFGKWTEVKFDKGAAIIGGSIINYLLEKSRVVFQGPEERNYHIFYQLYAGAEKTMHEADLEKNLMKRFSLDDLGNFHYTNQSGVTKVDTINDEREFEDLLSAMRVIEMTPAEIDAVLQITAAVLHLGNIKYEVDPSGDGESVYISNDDQLQTVASLLEVDVGELKRCLTSRGIGTREVVYKGYDENAASAARDALAKTIYGSLFDRLVMQINKTLATDKAVNSIMGVLDIFGFESFEKNSFEQLCINFCNEKLQFHFNEHIFRLEQEQYKAEGVSVDAITFVDNQKCLDLIEKKKAPAGIIPRIDEEIKTPNGSDMTFYAKLVKEFGKRGATHINFAVPGRKVKDSDKSFIVKHFAGPVCYDVTGFLEKTQDALHADITSVMKTTTSKLLGRALCRSQRRSGGRCVVSEEKEKLQKDAGRKI